MHELQREADQLPALAARVARLQASAQQAQDLREEVALLQGQEQEVAQLKQSIQDLRPRVTSLPQLLEEWRQASRALSPACAADRPRCRCAGCLPAVQAPARPRAAPAARRAEIELPPPRPPRPRRSRATWCTPRSFRRL